eukprot:5530119-Pyramimonas_sp.AAC.1
MNRGHERMTMTMTASGGGSRRGRGVRRPSSPHSHRCARSKCCSRCGDGANDNFGPPARVCVARVRCHQQINVLINFELAFN